MFVPLLTLTLRPHKLDAAEVYRRAKGAVVTVRTPEASGTGFALGDRRTVVTAYHVVRSSPESIRVDQTGSSAVRLVGFDEAADVALLELSRPISGALALRPTTPQPGTRVYAIGTPLGYLESTISEGIVSGVRRVGDVALIQITAPVSHGSSGGPVLDEEGRVVGVVDLAIESGQSLNFAMSAYTVGRALARIRAGNYQRVADRIVDEALRNRSRSRVFDDKARNQQSKEFGAFANLVPRKKERNPFLEAGLKAVRSKSMLLTGSAALYWMYRHDQAAANLTFEQRGRSLYYLSRNGMMYYRDGNAGVHWVSPPLQGLSVPTKEARACQGLQGYNDARAGETNLMRFATRRGGQ